jgi:hypothetical protein
VSNVCPSKLKFVIDQPSLSPLTFILSLVSRPMDSSAAGGDGGSLLALLFAALVDAALLGTFQSTSKHDGVCILCVFDVM